jgi:hypothetical protein
VALTLIPVVFATIPEPALILIAIEFAVTIELDRLILPAKTSNVLVVLPKALPFAVGIRLPSIDVLLYVRFPAMVKSPPTLRLCTTLAEALTVTFAWNSDTSPVTKRPLSTLKLVFAMLTLLD